MSFLARKRSDAPARLWLRARRKSFASIVVVSVLSGVALATLTGSLSALAHTELLSSNPAADSSVAQVSDITLTFGDEVVPDYTTLTLTDATGATIGLDSPTVDATHTTVSAHIEAAPLPAGAYSVAFYVVAIDGHPVEGIVNFVASGPPAPSPAESTMPATSSAEPLVTETPVAVAGEARLFTASNSSPDVTWVWVGTAIAAVVVVGVVSAVLLIALRRQREEDQRASK